MHTHPSVCEREMKEQRQAQLHHYFCKYAHEKQGSRMEFLQWKTVAQKQHRFNGKAAEIKTIAFQMICIFFVMYFEFLL